jgi:4-hydroxy-tetrahydrodipicolinate reductase
MNILLNGYCGFMGREVVKLCHNGYRGARLIAGVDTSAEGTYEDKVYSSPKLVQEDDIVCIIDFSHHSAVRDLLDFATERKIPVVVATTGHTEEELDAINEASLEIPVFHSGNMSLGIALLIDLATKTAKAMPEAEIEIVETHHNRKIDAPSGTALMIANAIKEAKEEASLVCGRSGHGKRNPSDIGIHSVRMGNVVGIHEVMIGTPNQTITLKHEAHNRALFAEGAIVACEFLIEMPKGKYDMNDLVSKANAETATV